MTHLGTHILADLAGIRSELLDDEASLRGLIERATAEAGGTLLATNSHQFEPCGVTAIVLLAESHISIHTWPELGEAAVDVYTCGVKMDGRAALDAVLRALEPETFHLTTHRRGLESAPLPPLRSPQR